jgi:putative two-component system response regulator
MTDPLDFSAKPVVLIVDDTPENLTIMNGLLKDEHRTKVANNGERALKLAAAEPKPDLVLLDIMMPGMDGYEVCRRLKADAATRDVPVIFLTAKTQVEDEQRGFDVGCVDYITKPISPPIVLARVRTHLALKAAADFLRDKNEYLAAEVARRTKQISTVQDVTIMAMASLAETRDNETGNHIRRTQHYVRALALELRKLPKFASSLDDTTVELLFKSAPLHDIGKVGIPDAILLKPGKLTPEEFEVMKTHAALGRDAIVAAEQLLDEPVSFLQYAREIAYCHQEKWDGSGYPEGLAHEQIPLSARLMAVADVYDALISRRVYKPPFPHAQAVAIIREGRGKHFDPEVVDAFLAIQDACHAIAMRYADSEAAVHAKAGRDAATAR